MPIQTNTAAWQVAPVKPLETGPSDAVAPEANEIVVRNAALAVNPADWILQDQPISDEMKYPMILGNDVAGEVTAVGAGVTRFKVGDRVLGQAVGCWTNQPHKGGFQTLTVLDANMASHLPDGMSFTDAVVLPLGVGTASCGLFQTDQLGLDHPTPEAAPTGKTVLVWGGASSVGSCGIQLARAAGYDVVTTASPKNFDAMRALGAAEVFDYHSPSLVDDLAAAMEGRTLAGALFTTGDMAPFCAVVAGCEGNRVVASTLPAPEDVPAGVTVRQIFGMTLKDNEVGKAVYEDFLGQALASGTFVPAPAPQVVGNGLEALQSALETQKAGVSARKIVVTLD